MRARDTDSPAVAARLDRSGRSLRRRPSRLPDARDGRHRAGPRDSCRARRTVARAHPALVRRPRRSPSRTPRPALPRRSRSPCGSRTCAIGCSRRSASFATRRPARASGDSRDLGSPAAALRILLAEDNVDQPEVSRSVCSSARLPRRHRRRRTRGARAARACPLRRRPHGRPDAGDGRPRGEPRHLRALARRRAPAHHRDDGRGDAGGPRQVPGGGHGRLHRQAGDAGRSSPRRSRSAGPWRAPPHPTAAAPRRRSKNAEPRPPSPSIRDVLDQLREDLGGSAALREVIETFLDQTPSVLTSLRDAATRADADGIRQAAHMIKGTSAMLGARELSEQCRRDRARRSSGAHPGCGDARDRGGGIVPGGRSHSARGERTASNVEKRRRSATALAGA